MQSGICMVASNHNEPVVQQIHQTLRVLHSPTKLIHSPLLASPLFIHQQRIEPDRSHIATLHALFDRLHEQLVEQDKAAADLLHGRFWEGLTVEKMLQLERPEAQSVSRFYQQQEQAILQLAQLWEEAEWALRNQQRANALFQRLPAATYTKLFGAGMIVQQVVDHLTSPDGPSIVVLKGIGGIGKSATADRAVRQLLQEHNTFTNVAWISAKQDFLTTSGIVQHRSGNGRELQLTQIFDELGEQLELAEIKQFSLARKVNELAQPLRQQPHLVVIDNLETVEEFQQLVPWLNQLTGPTRFLLASRETVPALAQVITIDLDGLPKEAALAFIDYTATEKQVNDYNGTAIYGLVGGNPLAIVLVISLMRHLPPSQVLGGVRSGGIADLYTYIYYKSWHELSEEARELLFTIQRAGDVAEWHWLEMVSEIESHTLQKTIMELMDFSLVYVQGGEDAARRYAIHRLTSTFLRTEILGWK